MSKKSKYNSLLSTIPTYTEPPQLEKTGDRIRFARTRMGKSAEWLATQVGCSQSTISQYERGVRDPNPQILSQIAEALGCRVYSLYTPEYFEKFKYILPLDDAQEADRDFDAYARDYRIGEDEYIRFSISFEKLTIEGRMKVFEYLEDIAAIERYIGEGWSSCNNKET